MAFPEISLQYNLKIIFNYSIINIQLLTRITMFSLISYPPHYLLKAAGTEI